jgi:uncharacterized membrane protein YdjX (TVP38/TMEM64 family)
MRLILMFFALVMLLLVPWLVVGDAIDMTFTGPEGLQRLEAYGPWAWLVGIGLLVLDLVLPVPATAVMTALGMIYGAWLGGLLGGVGSTLAGLVAYGGCRLLGHRFLDVLVGRSDREHLGRFFERHGLWAIALSRWLPIVPEALCCLAGMARMPALPFLAALSCGSLAVGFSFGLLGGLSLDRPVLGLAASALLPAAVWPVVYLWLRRARQST